MFVFRFLFMGWYDILRFDLLLPLPTYVLQLRNFLLAFSVDGRCILNFFVNLFHLAEDVGVFRHDGSTCITVGYARALASTVMLSCRRYRVLRLNSI